MAAWQEVHDGWRRRQQAAAAPGAQPAAAKDAAGAPPPPLLLASDGHLKPATKLLWADPKAKALAAMPRELLRALHASAARESGGLMLHPAVHALLLDSDDASGADAAALRKASTLVEVLRREAAADNRSLPERALYSRFFSAHAAAGARADAAAVVALTRHLKEKKQPELCSHALTAAGALSPLGRCAVGAAYANESLEELQRGATNFVSDAYVDAAASARERVSWRHFFVAAGASDGLSFEVSASPADASQRPKAMVLRQSSKAVVLPYGLGTLGHKLPIVVNAAFTPASAKLLHAVLAGGASADSGLAVAFCELVARAAIDVDETPSPTGPLAAALRGDTPSAHEQVADGRRATKQVGSGAPARKRVLWLPPAQAGAAVHDLGVAQFVVDLRSTAWVPTAGGGLQPPDRVALVAAGAAASTAASHLYVAALPPATLAALAAAPISSLLRWGTAPPPSPMERFKALVAAAERRAAAPAADAAAGPGLSEYCAVWAALAEAEAGGGSGIERNYIRRAAAQHALLPLQRTLVRSARVICSGPAAPATRNISNAAALADDMLCEALTQSGFLLDVKKSVALGAHAKALTSLLELPAAPPAATVERWLAATWKRPPPPAASAEGAELRTAFSLALRYVIVRRGGRDVATPPPEPPPAPPALERQHRDALRSLPGLRLWVATAPHAAATAAGSWAPFPPEPSAPLPLLADDTAKAGQLSGDLAVSFVQVLTHAVAAPPPLAAASSERARARDALLRQIDTDLLALLRVPRLSADGFELTTAPTGAAAPLPAAGERLAIVLKLLAAHAAEVAGAAGGDARTFAVDLVRHDELRRTLRVPALLGRPVARCSARRYAVVEAGANGGSIRVKVAGESEDYTADLQDEAAALLLPPHAPLPTRLLSSSPTSRMSAPSTN